MIRFRLFGVDIRLDFWFVALVTVFLLTDQNNISLIALLACLIHEAAHLLVFVMVGYTPQALCFELTGIRLVKPIQALSPGREALVQCAGSAANFLVFFLLAGSLGQLSDQSIFAVTHLLLGIFNLLPLRGLDGGKLLELLCLYFCGESRVEQICSAADTLTTFALLGMAVYALLSGDTSAPLLFFSGGLTVAALAKLRSCFIRRPAQKHFFE